jgi:integrase/recombinase XerD
MKDIMYLVQKRGWYHVIIDGKWKSLRTRDPAEAESLFKEMGKEWRRGRLIQLDNVKRKSLSEFAEVYIESRDVSIETLKKDKLSLKLFADVIGGSTQMQVAATKNKINDFKKAVVARKTKDITLNGYLRHIRAAFSWAVEEGYLKKAPSVKLKKISEEIPRVLDPDEIKAILRKAFKTDRDMGRRFFSHLYTGARRRELCNLKWPDLDFNKGQCRLLGKGGKVRIIPFLIPLQKMMTPVCKDIGYVFDEMHRDTVSKKFKKVARACDIDARLHDLRHTAATYMLKSGVSLKVVSAILGHVNISTTEIYAKVIDDMMRDEMARLKFK